MGSRTDQHDLAVAIHTDPSSGDTTRGWVYGHNATSAYVLWPSGALARTSLRSPDTRFYTAEQAAAQEQSLPAEHADTPPGTLPADVASARTPRERRRAILTEADLAGVRVARGDSDDTILRAVADADRGRLVARCEFLAGQHRKALDAGRERLAGQFAVMYGRAVRALGYDPLTSSR